MRSTSLGFAGAVVLAVLFSGGCGGGGGGGSSAPTPPAAPADFAAWSTAVDEVTVSFGAVPGATGYNLYWDLSPGVTPATGTKIPGVLSPSLVNAPNGSTYYFVLTAENAVGEGPPSGEVTVVPPPTPAPGFLLQDVNTSSATGGQNVSPGDFPGFVTAWYFGHST